MIGAGSPSSSSSSSRSRSIVEEDARCINYANFDVRMRTIKISTLLLFSYTLVQLSYSHRGQQKLKVHINLIRQKDIVCLVLTMPMAVLGRVLFGLAPPPPTKWFGAALDGRWALLPTALVGLPRAILVLLVAVAGLWRTIALPGRRIALAPRVFLCSTTPYPSDVARCCFLCCALASMTLAGEDLGLVRRLCGSAGELDRRFVGR